MNKSVVIDTTTIIVIIIITILYPTYRWGIAYRVILNGLGIYTTWTVIARWV